MLANAMTVTVKLTNEHALRLLEELQHLGALTIESSAGMAEPAGKAKPGFDAMRVDTRGFKFDRTEANER